MSEEKYDNCNYADLSEVQKRELFDRVNIFRGFRFTENNGIERSFNDLYAWSEGYLPDFVRPYINTEHKSLYSFSKISHELKKLNVSKGSASLSSQFATLESEYNHEKSRVGAESHVNEYLLEKFVVRKAAFNIDLSKIQVSEKFVDTVDNAISRNASDYDNAYNLINLLNEWGYYVPKTFTLGGCLYSEEVTAIDDYSESVVEKENFSASFKSSFESIGGSGSIGSASEISESSSSSSKYKNISIKQIGGIEGMHNDYLKWYESLFDAKNWDVAECEDLYPTILLLMHTNGYKDDIFMRCMQTLNYISTAPKLWKLQPFIDLDQYSLAIMTALNPF